MSDGTLSALVLGSIDLGEADRLVFLLTRERGRITARARGARKSRKRYGGRLERYSLIRAHVRATRGKAALGEVDLVRPFLGVREDLLRTAMADHLLELVRTVAPEEEPAPDLFGLLLAVLEVLDAGPTPGEGWVRAAAMRVFRLAGLGLALDGCAECGELPGQFPAGFSPAAGGVLCRGHSAEDPAAVDLARADLAYLRRLDTADLAAPAAADLPPAAARRVRGLVASFGEYHLERRPRTASFLDALLDG